MRSSGARSSAATGPRTIGAACTVRLTDLGRETLSGQDAWLRGRQRAFFEGLPQTERDLAPDLLVRLAALIDELAAGPG